MIYNQSASTQEEHYAKVYKIRGYVSVIPALARLASSAEPVDVQHWAALIKFVETRWVTELRDG